MQLVCGCGGCVGVQGTGWPFFRVVELKQRACVTVFSSWGLVLQQQQLLC
jgi:hypothetical protein